MPLRLIIFDLDGTLVDTSRDITNALNHAARPHGLEPLSVKETTALVGEGTTRLVEKLLGPERAALKDKVLRDFLAYYSGHLTDESTVYPNVRETLGGLSALHKAVISNKKEGLSKRLLQALGLSGYFAVVVGSDTVAERKPSPVPVEHVLHTLGAGPEEALMVGDSTYDMEAGRKAGLRTVAVTYGYREREALRGADHMIEDMAELPPLLYEKGYLPERRREKRFPVPAIYRKYISLALQSEGGLLGAALCDFSPHGLKLISPVPLREGELQGCVVSIPGSLSREVAFKARIRDCREHEGGFLAGGEIEEVEDEVWFRVFRHVHDFIRKRAGEVF